MLLSDWKKLLQFDFLPNLSSEYSKLWECKENYVREKMVGTVRFELTASCSQSRRANQTTLRPGQNIY